MANQKYFIALIDTSKVWMRCINAYLLFDMYQRHSILQAAAEGELPYFRHSPDILSASQNLSLAYLGFPQDSGRVDDLSNCYFSI